MDKERFLHKRTVYTWRWVEGNRGTWSAYNLDHPQPYDQAIPSWEVPRRVRLAAGYMFAFAERTQ